MQFTELALDGAHLIEVEPHEDARGFFARTFCARELERRGLVAAIAQCSTSFNRLRGTVRGMHFQTAPHEEVKIVRCTAGAIFDVIVDIRPGSATFGKSQGIELTHDNHRMLYIPRGFAHGFQSLENGSEVLYQISVEYVPEASRGFRWDDPTLEIPWPIQGPVIVSEKDRALPLLSEIALR